MFILNSPSELIGESGRRAFVYAFPYREATRFTRCDPNYLGCKYTSVLQHLRISGDYMSQAQRLRSLDPHRTGSFCLQSWYEACWSSFITDSPRRTTSVPIAIWRPATTSRGEVITLPEKSARAISEEGRTMFSSKGNSMPSPMLTVYVNGEFDREDIPISPPSSIVYHAN